MTDRIGFQSAGAVRKNRPLRIFEMSVDQLAARIEELRPIAESGEDWAHICELEAEAISRREDDGQFGVGA